MTPGLVTPASDNKCQYPHGSGWHSFRHPPSGSRLPKWRRRLDHTAGEQSLLSSGDGTIIDSTSQTSCQGNTNPAGPEIELDGTNTHNNGFWIDGSSDNIIRGLIINRFTSGINIQGQ